MVDEAPHHHLRGPSRRGAGSASASGCCSRCSTSPIDARRARGDARGPAVEPAGPPAVREVRVPAGRPPAALLQRQRRGRPDHDHRAAARRRRCASGSRGCAPRSTPRPPRPVPTGARRGRPARGPRVSGPLVLAIESSCDETGIALIEDGRRIVSNVVASQVALHAPSGGIVPEVAARAHLRWIVPVLDEAWAAMPGATGTTSTRSPSPTARGSRARCSSASTSRRRSPGSTTSRSSGSTTSRATSTPRWLRDPGEDETSAGAGLPARRARRLRRPHVPRRDARPPDLPAAGHDASTTPRARRSTRSGGCSGWGTRAGRRSSGRPRAATRHDRVFPRAWLGDSYDLSFSGLKTAARRIVTEARADAGPAADDPRRRCPTTSSPSSPGGSRTRSSTCWRPRRSAPRARSAPARSCSAAGRRQQRPARPTRRRGRGARAPADRAATGAVHGQRGDDRRRRAPAASLAGERAGLDLDARPSLPLAAR